MMAGLLDLMPADNVNRAHWEGARQGRLLVQQCGGCARRRFPAAALCPACGSRAATWVETSPRGRVLAWCRFHRAYFDQFREKLPYTVLLVELEEGLRIYANPATGDEGAIPAIGAAVTAVFEPVDDRFGLVRMVGA